MKVTPLHSHHQKLGAKLCPFAGYEMPLSYTSMLEEASSVRENVGLFDVSHMGEFWVKGPETLQFLNFLLPRDLGDSPVGKAWYSPLLNEKGMILDDLIVYIVEKDKALVCVNASNTLKDWNHIRDCACNYDIQVEDVSEEYSLLALQGPSSQKVLSTFFDSANGLKRFHIDKFEYNGKEILISRTGYTGEDGFEIFLPSDSLAVEFWTKFMELNVTPCGLGSRDILRIEAGYPLYGNELSDELFPHEVGLKWTLSKKNFNYLGSKAVQSHNPRFHLKKFICQGGIPRSEQQIINLSGTQIGHVTSGTYSPTLKQNIGIALLDKELSSDTSEFLVDLRRKKVQARVVSKFIG